MKTILFLSVIFLLSCSDEYEENVIKLDNLKAYSVFSKAAVQCDVINLSDHNVLEINLKFFIMTDFDTVESYRTIETLSPYDTIKIGCFLDKQPYDKFKAGVRIVDYLKD